MLSALFVNISFVISFVFTKIIRLLSTLFYLIPHQTNVALSPFVKYCLDVALSFIIKMCLDSFLSKGMVTLNFFFFWSSLVSCRT